VTGAILVLNAGSSSLKFALFDGGAKPLAGLRGQVAGLGQAPRFEGAGIARKLPKKTSHADAVALVLDWIATRRDAPPLRAVGHRIVHGGVKYRSPTRLTKRVLAELDRLVPLAPLHQPHNLAAVRAVALRRPRLPQIGCFDTAFHATQPRLHRLFGLPRDFAATGVMRYGFHGLSYEGVVEAWREHFGRLPRRLLAYHLGNGASAAAIRDGKSVATSMGFSTLEGLMMGTRPGRLDPGVLLYLLQEKRLSPAAVSDLLYRRGGLLGVSGKSADMRVLLAARDRASKEAVALFIHRAVVEGGALVAAMGGLDAIAFTGGIGENAPAIRARIIAGLAHLNARLDARENHVGQVDLSGKLSPIQIALFRAEEESLIARHVLDFIED